MPQEQLDPQVVNLAKSLRNTETKGDFNAKGAAGEWGAYQFMPKTWDNLSQKYGINAKFGEATPEQQNEAAYRQIKEWKDAGNNIGQIASMWNAGEGEPNAYTGKFSDGSPSVKAGKFDVPKYAQSVASYYQQLKNGVIQPTITPNASTVGANQGQQPQQDESLTGKLEGRLNDTATELGSDQSIPSKILQTVGQGAGAVGDVVGSALELIPGVKQAEGLIGKGVGLAANTDAGRKVIQGYSDFAQAHPEIAGDIGAVGNIATLLPIGKGFGLAKEGVARALGKTSLSEAMDVVRPSLTKGAAEKAVAQGRATKSGIMGRISVADDPKTVRAGQAVEQLVKSGKVSAKKTMIENANAIHDEIGTTANKLISDLESQDIMPIVQPEELRALYTDAMKKIEEGGALTGDAGKYAQDMLKQFEGYLPKQGDITASDILKARKKLDAWVGEQKGGTVFDPTRENAISIALRAVRQNANELLASKAPSVQVKSLLQHQSNLYDALDSVKSKAAKEIGTTRLGRLAKRHPHITGLVRSAGRYGLIGAGVPFGEHIAGSVFGE